MLNFTHSRYLTHSENKASVVDTWQVAELDLGKLVKVKVVRAVPLLSLLSLTLPPASSYHPASAWYSACIFYSTNFTDHNIYLKQSCDLMEAIV